MIERVVRIRIHGETPRRAMLESLIDRQDNQLARSGQSTMIQKPGQVGQGSRIIAAVPTQYFLDAGSDHRFGFKVRR